MTQLGYSEEDISFMTYVKFNKLCNAYKKFNSKQENDNSKNEEEEIINFD